MYMVCFNHVIACNALHSYNCDYSRLGLSQLFYFFYLLFYSEFPPNAPIIPKDCPIILNYNSELFPSKIKESAYKNMYSYESTVVLSIRVFSIVLTPRV